MQVSKERRSSKQLAESTVLRFDIHSLRAANTGAFMVITCTVQGDKDRTRAATGSAFFSPTYIFPYLRQHHRNVFFSVLKFSTQQVSFTRRSHLWYDDAMDSMGRA